MLSHDCIHIKKKQRKSESQLYPSRSNHNKLLKIGKKLEFLKQQQSCDELNLLLLQTCEEDNNNDCNE